MQPHHLYDLYQMLKAPWKTPQTIRSLQEKKLSRLISHAYRNVHYYREVMDSRGIKPSDIRTIEDLQAFPITSKKELQALTQKETLAQNIDPKQCKTFATSGTTGLPLKTFFTRQDNTLKNLSWARVFLTGGMRPWHRMAAFVGQPVPKAGRSWYERLGLWRRKEISTWNSPETWINDILSWKPQVLVGYVMTLKIFGETLQADPTREFKPRIIFHSSAVLDDASRQFLKSAFACRIMDIYGSDEAGCIAWECEFCSGYHLCSDMVILEILKEGKPVSPGEKGEVVMTNLHSYAMPFIRYRQGDVVTLSHRESACGRNFPLLERIQGRTDDFIVLKDGRKLSPHPFYHSIDPAPGVRRWKIVQETPDQLTVMIEPGEGFNRETNRWIEDRLRRLVGKDMNISIQMVDSIKIDPSSKFRSVSSNVCGYV
jgi:phenylacetate-CoA ligase